ncbi:MAG: hypothetical protein IPK27_19915 [Rhodanobacteraceae bacterium]|nr:hypothetical protein [Rhodanobacteraceae bacterium]
MTIDELENLVTASNWFSRVGEFQSGEDAVSLESMAGDLAWNWLPTSRDQEDPVHGENLRVLVDLNGKGTERRDAELRVVKTALRSMRRLETYATRLVETPHDYNIAAQSGAQYAARMAAREIIAEKCGFWCRVIRLYAIGYWPCGLTEDKRLVVY